MGLDTSHDAWSGPYGHFSKFRNAIAVAAGLEIYTEEDGFPTVNLNWDKYERKNFQGLWDKDPDDVLEILIVHSDCDGIIKNKNCMPLASRLRRLRDKVDETWHDKLDQFIKGLEEAYVSQEDLDFH